MDQGTCSQDCYALPDAYEFSSACTPQPTFTLEQCSTYCENNNCEGFNMLESGGCEIVTSVTDSGSFHFVPSYNNNFHVKGLSNGADGLEPRISFDAHHNLNVGVDVANDSIIANANINIDLTQVEDAFIATSQEKGLYEPESADWDSDCTKMQNGYCKVISKFHECADICNNDPLCKGYLQVGSDQCQIVHDDSGITTNRLGTETYWRQSGVADFCAIHTSATEIYVKLELSEYDAQLYDSHNTAAEGIYSYLPVDVNFKDLIHSNWEQNKIYTSCPPGYGIKVFDETAGSVDYRCVLDSPGNFAQHDGTIRYNTYANNLSYYVRQANDVWGGCGLATGSASGSDLQMRLRPESSEWFGCGDFKLPGCSTSDWKCGLNAECVSEVCQLKSGLSTTEYLVDSSGESWKFTPVDDASYITAKNAYELNEDTGISTYGSLSSWDLTRVTTRPYLTFDNIWLNSGVLGPIPGSNGDEVVFRPQSFIRTTSNNKDYLEIRYFSNCTSESVLDSTNQFVSFCRIDGDTIIANQATDSVTSHSFLYGTNIVNIPVNYNLEPQTEGYRRALMANTGNLNL